MDKIARWTYTDLLTHQRSRLVCRLLEDELLKRDSSLAAACRAANLDSSLQHEIEEWQASEDSILF